ncbi:MAG: hypothetical protein ACI965_001974 [Paraglaciecola sp.]|jgi:hypothetical protein
MKWLLITLIFLSFSLRGQTCLSSITETAPESDFMDNGDGTVTDPIRDLSWMRCSIGQNWDELESRCEGDASELNWQQALQAAHGFVYANKLGWRVPNVKELSSITERRCVRPAINEVLFPNTPSDDFWTSTPSVQDPSRAWVIAFFNSSNSIKQKNLFVFTRLVRTAD